MHGLEFRQIADKCDAVLMCDVAQISGLISAKVTDDKNVGKKAGQKLVMKGNRRRHVRKGAIVGGVKWVHSDSI